MQQKQIKFKKNVYLERQFYCITSRLLQKNGLRLGFGNQLMT